MHDAQITLEAGESIKIHDYDHGLFVHVWKQEDGTLSTTVSNGEVDWVQIESREEVTSIKALRSGKLQDL